MANKTTKQIADELGISKQKVYRYIKENHIKEALQDGQTKWYNETVQKRIKEHFSNNEPHQKTTSEARHDVVYEALLKQLEIKDQQIENLTKLLDQEQQLNAINQQKILALEEKQEQPKKHWWSFVK